MGKGGKSVNDEVINLQGHERHRVKNIFDVTDEIQQYAAMEELMIFDTNNQSTIEKYFTFSMRLEYFMVGFKAVMHSFLFALLFHPLFFAVLHRKLPIFGFDTEVDFFDIAYISILSFGLSFIYLAFFIWICQFNKGKATESMIKNFIGGVSMGSFVKMILGFLIMNGLYFIVFTEQNIEKFVDMISKIYTSEAFLQTLRMLLYGYRDGLINAGITSLIIGIIYTVSVWIGFYYFNKKKHVLTEF